MNTTLTNFAFDEHLIRNLIIDGEPWFVGKDVAMALGYADPTNAMKQHCKGVVKRHPLSTAGGIQEVRILSEPDVLRLIINSHLPAAEQFERWVFEEVLPSIRKTGNYSVVADEQAAQCCIHFDNHLQKENFLKDFARTSKKLNEAHEELIDFRKSKQCLDTIIRILSKHAMTDGEVAEIVNCHPTYVAHVRAVHLPV